MPRVELWEGEGALYLTDGERTYAAPADAPSLFLIDAIEFSDLMGYPLATLPGESSLVAWYEGETLQIETMPGPAALLYLTEQAEAMPLDAVRRLAAGRDLRRVSPAARVAGPSDGPTAGRTIS